MEPSVVELVELTQRFLAGEVDAPTFDRSYRRAFAQLPLLGEPLFAALERLAVQCAEYVDVPELREPGDVDDEALADAARRALRELEEL